jgi:hypothetical protein
MKISESAPLTPEKVAVIVPTLTGLEPGTAGSLARLRELGYSVFVEYGHSDISGARSRLASRMMVDRFRAVMWIDSDILFNPSDVDRLVDSNLPIVGGIYAKKGAPMFACLFLPGTKHVAFGEKGGLIEVMGLGTGFLLIRREAFDAMRELCPLPVCSGGVVPYFSNIIGNSDGKSYLLSEHYSFCEMARRAGLKVMADTTIRLGHIGKYSYSWEEVAAPVQRVTSVEFQAEAVGDAVSTLIASSASSNTEIQKNVPASASVAA